MNHESPRAALGAMARRAFDAHDLPLFDQAHSERQAYDGTIANLRVQHAMERQFIYACSFCGRWRQCLSAEHRAALAERGFCWACDEDDFAFARRRLARFTRLTLGGGIAALARHHPVVDQATWQRYRQFYRRCETIRRGLERAFADVEISL